MGRSYTNGGSYRQEKMAVNGDAPLVFRRAHCDVCQEEKIFRGLKCASCGQFKKLVTPRGQVAQYQAKKPLTYYVAKTVDRNRARLSDKKAYYARLAEESRKKFEGK